MRSVLSTITAADPQSLQKAKSHSCVPQAFLFQLCQHTIGNTTSFAMSFCSVNTMLKIPLSVKDAVMWLSFGDDAAGTFASEWGVLLDPSIFQAHPCVRAAGQAGCII